MQRIEETNDFVDAQTSLRRIKRSSSNGEEKKKSSTNSKCTRNSGYAGYEIGLGFKCVEGSPGIGSVIEYLFQLVGKYSSSVSVCVFESSYRPSPIAADWDQLFPSIGLVPPTP